MALWWPSAALSSRLSRRQARAWSGSVLATASRHTHATILLSDREPVSTVSQRLGRKSEAITLTIYSHVLPGDQKRAAARFAELVGEA